MSNTESNPSNPPPGAFRFRESFEATAEDRAALSADELLPINVELTTAAHIAMTALPKILALRAQLATLPIKLEQIEKIDTYARAVGHAQALFVVASTPPEELQALYEDAVERRTALRSDVHNLATHGLINGEGLAALSGEVGYRNVGYDLMSLVAMMRGAASRIAGRSASLPEDLDRSEFVANQLLEVVARREGDILVPAAIASDRQRAFTLLAQAYDEARRAVTFLRWSADDANRIAPSLHTNRGGTRRKSEPATPQSDIPPPPPALV
jgi:hypothetical protein